VLALALLALGQAPAAPSWPCWRGADGTNVSSERDWSSQGAAEPLWRAEVGRGHSSCAIVAGRLYTHGFDEAKQVDRVSCLDTLTGQELWRHEYPATLDALGHGGGTHSTPSVHDGVVYSFERQGVLRALAAADGKLLWQVDVVAEHEVKPTDYGFASAPLVVGERLYVNAESVLCFERTSGEPLWKSADVGAYYSTPAWVTLGGKARVASFGRPGLDLVDPESGDVVAHFPFKKGATSVSASSPVVVDDTHLFISAGYGHGAALVDFAAAEPRAEWESKAMKTTMSGCVLVGGNFYGFDESVLKCLGLDGKEKWRERGLGQGALTASADGRLIVLSGEGELVIVAADPAAYRELARQPVLTGATFWSSPVLCAGRIHVRSGEGELACFERGPAR
jgi:outer membrane protein assembly factor BamB